MTDGKFRYPTEEEYNVLKKQIIDERHRNRRELRKFMDQINPMVDEWVARQLTLVETNYGIGFAEQIANLTFEILRQKSFFERARYLFFGKI
jgi:hypothetical protein